MRGKPKILICGVLPPPCFGHSILYKMLMESSFPQDVDVKFLNMHFWSYKTNKKITFRKIFKMIRYYAQYISAIIIWRPQYILYNSSFYRMPFLKDALFYVTGILSGVKVICHDHGQYVRELHDSLPAWQRSLLCWILARTAGSIVMGQSVRNTYQGLMDDNRIVVVPGSVEDTRDLDVEPDRPAGNFLNILYFSHMSKPKGIFVAFDAVKFVLQENKQLAVTFGGPIENDEVASKLEELKKEYPGRVRYLGYVEDVRRRTAIFRGADIFIFTTLRDVFGLVLLHAMCEGIPIVASREGTIPEILPGSDYGFLFEKGNVKDLAENILKLAKDEGQRKLMAVQNRKRFEEVYSLAQYGRNMINALETIQRSNDQRI